MGCQAVAVALHSKRPTRGMSPSDAKDRFGSAFPRSVEKKMRILRVGDLARRRPLAIAVREWRVSTQGRSPRVAHAMCNPIGGTNDRYSQPCRDNGRSRPSRLDP
jgi:hypothetical protein